MRAKMIGNHEFPLPTQAHAGDAGYDLVTTKDLIIKNGAQVLVHTGWAVEIPMGYAGIVKDRSGMAKRGLVTAGGVIDSTYRGEVMVLLRNTGTSGDDCEIIEAGDRIAQMLVIPCYSGYFTRAEELYDSHRGHCGFGSTGK